MQDAAEANQLAHDLEQIAEDIRGRVRNGRDSEKAMPLLLEMVRIARKFESLMSR